MLRLSLLKKALMSTLLFGLGLILAACLPRPAQPGSMAVYPASTVQISQANAATAPLVTHGPISGEITEESAVLWARGNQTGTLVFEVATDANFTIIVNTSKHVVNAQSDFTGKVSVAKLKPAQTYFYRATLQTGSQSSPAVNGKFLTAPDGAVKQDFHFVFGACLGGQNYCRNPKTGWTIFDKMGATQPDFFLLTGDSIYADTPCKGDNNVPGAEGPYTDLNGLRTRYRYHLEDKHYASFLAQTPVYTTWDDHEVLNDFSGLTIKTINPQMFKDGIQAYFEYWPLQGTSQEPNRIYRKVSYGAYADFFILDTRSYRDPNVNWDPNPVTLKPKTMLGAEQFAWLQQGLTQSKATWKFIVSSVPLAYPTGFPQPQVDGRDGWANYTEQSGYETELGALIFTIAQHNVRNVVFLTGDAHWPYALSYDPDRDGAVNFYEFSSSPLSAIPLAPPKLLDPTFNPTVLYAEGEFQGKLFNFGEVAVNAQGDLTYRVLDGEGKEHYTLTLKPK